jgi:two-component system sensor histidine kinase VanS
MRKSITAKLFLLTAILLSIFLLFTMLFQLTFFEKFYMAAREKHINENASAFINEYKACKGDKTATIELIDRFELKNNAALILFDKKMKPVLLSENENSINLIDKKKLINNLLQNNITIKYKSEDSSNEVYSLVISPHEKGTSEEYITYYINTFPVNGNETVYILYMHKEMTEVKDATYALYKYFIAASVVVILLLSSFYARLIARPLVKLNKSASKMAGLDFTQKIKTGGNDEIGKLGGTLNMLSQKLNSTLNELKETNSRLQSDIDKEKQLTKMRKDFIATVSHELKSPLALIKGYAQAFRDRIVKEDMADYYSDVILDESNKMSELIVKMLELTELESDYVTISSDKFNVTDLTALMVRKFLPLSSARGIEVDNSISGKQIVCADRIKIEQVFENLLSNAIKHTPNEGRISIWAKECGAELLVNIDNTGSHISENEIDNIWDMFYRSKKKGERNDSTGLGLAIAKKIFELHSMKYGVRNTENGVCFYFTLKCCNIL